jgi:hypothetical protein
MSEHLLEEQIRRIRELTDQVSRFRSRAAELSDEVARTRASGRGSPLQEVRDFRRFSPVESQPVRAATADDGIALVSRRRSSRRRHSK